MVQAFLTISLCTFCYTVLSEYFIVVFGNKVILLKECEVLKVVGSYTATLCAFKKVLWS